jgi:hypothetical protein
LQQRFDALSPEEQEQLLRELGQLEEPGTVENPAPPTP